MAARTWRGYRRESAEHTAGGLSPDAAIEPAVRGFQAGTGGSNALRLVLVAMRQRGDSDLVADLAPRHRENGVVGFDLAGIESGHRNADHLDAVRRVRDGGLSVTLHGGDEKGIESILEAVEMCGATRIGVAHHVIDELSVSPDGSIEVGPEQPRSALR